MRRRCVSRVDAQDRPGGGAGTHRSPSSRQTSDGLPAPIVSVTVLVAAENSDTVPSWRLAAQTPSRSAASALGPCPTVTVWRTVLGRGSIRETLPSRSSATQIAPGPTATADGGPSSLTWRAGSAPRDRSSATASVADRRDAGAAVGPQDDRRAGGDGGSDGGRRDQRASREAPAAAALGLERRPRRPRPARRPCRTAWPGPSRAPARAPRRAPGSSARSRGGGAAPGARR